jgi:hypothetical protein
MPASIYKGWKAAQSGGKNRRSHNLYGRLGPASACGRIDPKSGKVIDELRPRYRRDFTRPTKLS